MTLPPANYSIYIRIHSSIGNMLPTTKFKTMKTTMFTLMLLNTHAHTPTHARTPTHMHTPTQMHTPTHMHTHPRTHTHTPRHVHTHTHTHTHWYNIYHDICALVLICYLQCKKLSNKFCYKTITFIPYNVLIMRWIWKLV